MKIFTLAASISLLLISCSSSRRLPPPPPPAYPDEVVIIIDGNQPPPETGKRLPPGQAKKIYGHKSAKVFAPGQRKKYEDKYGYVPPLVIQVPARLYSYSDGRAYYIYKNNFWYWKQRDGYFHLDKKYYRSKDRDDD